MAVGGVSSLGPSGTDNPYTTTKVTQTVPPDFGPPTVGSLGPLGKDLNVSPEQTPQGASLNEGYHAFRYAFQVALPSLRHQMDILAHRGIGG